MGTASDLESVQCDQSRSGMGSALTPPEPSRKNNVLTLRYLLALGVIFFHAQSWNQNPYFFNYPLVPVFLTLSGALVLQSLKNSSYPAFFRKRVLRIYPALIVGFILAIPIMASIRDTLAWYLSGGVFGTGDAMYPSWSLMWEQVCYVVLAALFWLGIYNNPRLLVSLTIIALAIALMWHPSTEGGRRAPMLFACFFVGNCIYVFRNKLRGVPMPLVILFSISGLIVYQTASWSVLTSAAGCTLWALRPGIIGYWIEKRIGDASVGLYLYHWQVLHILRLTGLSFIWTAVLVFPVTFALSYASWHLIELKIQRLGASSLVPVRSI